MDSLIKRVQEFYAQHMENHGFGRKTFVYETEAHGKAVVHHWKSQYTYAELDQDRKYREGLPARLISPNFINFYMVDVDWSYPCGQGGGNGRTGMATVSSGCLGLVLTAVHELGHAFGLGHDYRPFGGNWKSVLGIVDPMITSFCAAKWLDVIPAFNATTTPLDQRATIEMLEPPTLVAAPTTFRFRFKVEDPDGLHQLQLQTRDPLVGHEGDSLLDYKELKGVRSSTVEFVIDILLGPTTRGVVAASIDVHGNTRKHLYPVNLTSLLPAPEPVSIPDANLAAAVRAALQLSPGERFTTHVLLNLLSLDLRNKGVKDLTGLEHAARLTNLTLVGNPISDIAPLSTLTQLTNLNFSRSGVSDVSPLSALTQLTNLNLDRNRVSDVSALSTLTQLTNLSLDLNRVSDVSPLSTLTQLTNLSLNSNPISDVSALSTLTQLTNLNLSLSRTSDVSPLSTLTQLTNLWLRDNLISDVSALSTLTQLVDLNLSGNVISDVSALSTLTQLIDLRLDRNVISDVSPLSTLTQLTNLWLRDNLISDVSALSTLTQLTALNLGRNNIADISVFSELIQLDRLVLDNNDIADVSPLLTLNLTETHLDSTGLYLIGNPLSFASINMHIPALQAKGTQVVFDNRAYPALLKISGDRQRDLAGQRLESPLVLEVQDERGRPMPDVTVTFTIDTGGGMLNPTKTVTDADGKARTSLTLGWGLDTSAIRATATGIPSHVRFTATATTLPRRIAEDVNGDGGIDVEDLVLVASSFGAVPAPGLMPNTDVNGDGKVNNEDLRLVLAALEAAPAAPALDTQWTVASLQHWITEAKLRNSTDAMFLKGITVLEQWLADFLPKETALLPNYPNPFNPETWIPYQLSEAGEVTLHIYSVNGALVRTLALGHRPAGMYDNKNRSAYWDGRNEHGEAVASGVYFYTLSARNFTATRKMLIMK